MKKYYIVLHRTSENSYLIYDYMKNRIFPIVADLKFRNNQLIAIEDDLNINKIKKISANSIDLFGTVELDKFFTKIIRLNTLRKFNEGLDYIKEFTLAKRITVTGNVLNGFYRLVFIDHNLLHQNNNIHRILRDKIILNHNLLNEEINKWFVIKVERNNFMFNYNIINEVKIGNIINENLVLEKKCENYFEDFSLNYKKIFNELSNNNYLINLMMDFSVYEIFDKIMLGYCKIVDNNIYRVEDTNNIEFVFDSEPEYFENKLLDFISKLEKLEYFEKLSDESKKILEDFKSPEDFESDIDYIPF